MRVRPSLILALLTATVLLPLGLAGTANATPAPHPAASPAAHAVTADPQGTVRVFGFLRNTAEDNEPVEGVTIAVTTPDGEEVGSATTDDEGAYSIEVPGPGAYVVELDEDSLPDGVELRDDIQNPLDITSVAERGAAARVRDRTGHSRCPDLGRPAPADGLERVLLRHRAGARRPSGSRSSSARPASPTSPTASC